MIEVSGSIRLPTRRDSSNCLRRSAVVMALGLALPCGAAAQNTTRVVEYSYNATTGLVELERVDPGGTHCAETAYTYDAYGNKATIVVRPCAVGPTAATTFPTRTTQNLFAVKTSGTTEGEKYPAGAFLTRTTQLRTDGSVASRTDFEYDARFGGVAKQTEVAHVTVANNLSKRVIYDAFGRVYQEYGPINRVGTTTTEGYVEYERVYCQGPYKVAGDATCISFEPTDVSTRIDSWMLADKTTGAVLAKQQASTSASAITAYYIRSTPKSANVVIGAKSVTHMDSLHRTIAKETESYDGRWSSSLAVFNNLGMEAAKWAPYFGRSGAGAAFASPAGELRQWTSHYDLLHRPKLQSQHWRGAAGAAATVVNTEVAYAGLRTTVTVPSDSSPDGVARTKTAIKNPEGKVTQTIDPYGATLNSGYDASGNLVKTVDALGIVTTISYSTTTARFKTGMTDPNQGTWSYTYNALGQMVTQTDAKNQQTKLTYDILGRLIQRETPTQNGNWYYDKTAAGAWCASGLNRLCEAKAGVPVTNAVISSSSAVYDTMGRVVTSTDVLDRSYTNTTTFDALGRVGTFKYPTNFTLRYDYSVAAAGRIPGVLEKVSDAAAPTTRVFWSIANAPSAAFDARGNVLRSTLGNALATDNAFDSISGKAFTLRTGVPANGYVGAVDHRYTYDKANNVGSRSDHSVGSLVSQTILDTYEYDKLDRLTKHSIASGLDAAANRSVFVQYNAIGNVLSKSDVGGYTYGALNGPRPHAVTAAAGVSYGYDANGQLTSASGDETRSVTWTGFNHAATMSYKGATTAFKFDHTHRRIQETVTQGANVRTVYFVHPNNVGGLSYEREETKVGATVTRDESRHYISVGGAVVAVVKTLNGAGVVSSDNNLTQYWHKDALGSVVAVSNAAGVVQERMAFDAWGRRVRSTGLADAAVNPAHGDRGYTGHEHLDEQGLIHMNGRIAHPLLGRFLSSDPHVQDPNDLQNFNRYSYVLNNPLKYTDPSGEFWWYVAAYVAGAALSRNGNEYWQIVGMGLMAYGGAGAGGAFGGTSAFGVTTTTQIVTTLAFGAVGGLSQPGAGAEQAIVGGIFGLAMAAVGSGLADTYATDAAGKTVLVASNAGPRMAAHTLLGCMQGMASGGKCGPSAAAALVGKGTTEALANSPMMVQGTATIIMGGTASVLGGGKFANGALQAGFGYLFNHLGHCLANPMACARAAQAAGSYLVARWGPTATQLVWEFGAAEGVVASGGVSLALRTQLADEVVSGLTNAHHAWPKYLGGADAQDLVSLPQTLHRAYHAGLDQIAARWEGAAGFNAASVAEQAQRLTNFQTYTQWFDKTFGTSMMDAARRAGFACPGKIPGHGC